MALIDITPTVREDLAVFPGCTPFKREVQLDLSRGDSVTVSSITATSHLGAHVDAPSHYHLDGETMEQRSLDHFYGRAQVLGVDVPRGKRIGVDDVVCEITEKRVLFKTDSFPDPYQWNGDFNGLEPELIDYLAEHGVITIGVDTPSVDLADDKELLAHNRIFTHDIAILEGVILHDVPAGVYTLIALPLKIAAGDASPVRAVLVDG